jgi:hypothetical protein
LTLVPSFLIVPSRHLLPAQISSSSSAFSLLNLSHSRQPVHVLASIPRHYLLAVARSFSCFARSKVRCLDLPSHVAICGHFCAPDASWDHCQMAGGQPPPSLVLHYSRLWVTKHANFLLLVETTPIIKAVTSSSSHHQFLTFKMPGIRTFSTCSPLEINAAWLHTAFVACSTLS